MNKITIYLNDLELKTFTEQDAEDYCQLNSINPENIEVLNLSGNELIDVSSVKIFKNVEILWLYNNKITDISVLKNLKSLSIANNNLTDISVIKYLNNLEYLNIDSLELDSDQIKSLKNLKELWCHKGFKDMSLLNQFNKNINYN